ncbi:MAG: hypothetical protein ACYCUM_09150 [Solirubrobacteraceae bacterium]
MARKEKAPSSDYVDGDGNVLSLRGSLTLGARREYAELRAGRGGGSRPGHTPQDAEQRALELLFERLAVRWAIAGMPLERQRDLLARYRLASADERAFVRAALREHCEQWFPDVAVP